MFSRTAQRPKKIRTDKGKEFVNKLVRGYMKSLDIKIFSKPEVFLGLALYPHFIFSFCYNRQPFVFTIICLCVCLELLPDFYFT